MHPAKAFLLSAAIAATPAFALDYRHSTRVSPGDYLMRSLDQHQDNIFDSYRTVDLGASIGVGSDCGRIDFTGTLRASLKNLLDSRYFADIGKNIIASSPMLLACYFSPTWCAILKHSQMGAHYLSQMRLDQCAVIDKYVDNRVEEFYQERQSCVRKAIEQNQGDLEHAMESCQGNNLWNVDIANWEGRRNGEKVASNKLLESSAKWAGFEGPEAKQSLDLLKAFVGETVVSHGQISVEYGPRQSALTPRTYLQSIEKTTYDSLCNRFLRRMDSSGDAVDPDRVVTDQELRSLSTSTGFQLLDRQTLRALAVMPPRQRMEACKLLSDALSMTVFSADANRSLDMLATLAQNPNLPPNRKREIEQKRQALKESVEMAITLQRQKNVPLGSALARINQEGQRLHDRMLEESLTTDRDREGMQQVKAQFMNCADGVLCDGR